MGKGQPLQKYENHLPVLTDKIVLNILKNICQNIFAKHEFVCLFSNIWDQTEEARLDLGLGERLTMWSDLTLMVDLV